MSIVKRKSKKEAAENEQPVMLAVMDSPLAGQRIVGARRKFTSEVAVFYGLAKGRWKEGKGICPGGKGNE